MDKESFDVIRDALQRMRPGHTHDHWVDKTCPSDCPEAMRQAALLELEQVKAEQEEVNVCVDYALKDYPLFNSERCVSALLKIRSALGKEKK